MINRLQEQRPYRCADGSGGLNHNAMKPRYRFRTRLAVLYWTVLLGSIALVSGRASADVLIDPPPQRFDVPGGYSSRQILVRCPVGTNPIVQPSRSFVALSDRWSATHCRPAYPFEFADPELASRLGLDRMFVVEVPQGTDTVMMARAYARLSGVSSAEPVAVGEVAQLIPNDSGFGIQWNMHNVLPPPIATDADVDGPGAWGIETGQGQPVTIAIVDTGITPHIEFAGRMVPGINTSDATQPNLTSDGCPHGTHVAGIAAAQGNNGIGVAGMSWGAKLMPVRVFDGCSGTELDTAAGIIWAVDNGADVLNISLQFYSDDSSPTNLAMLEDAVDYAYAQGVVVVAAAGNERCDPGNPTPACVVSFPAAFDNAIAVSATNNRDLLAVFSNYGPEVDIAAPGDNIYSTWIANNYAVLDGTSMASPHVAGLAALLKSYDPLLTNVEIREIMLSTADDLGPCGVDNKYGAGRMNAYRALRLAAGFGPAGIVGSMPETCSIDARQPFELDGSDVSGWQMLELTFAGNVAGLSRSDFIIHQVGGAGFPPSITNVVAVGNDTVEVHLSRPISVGAWATISHEPTGTSMRVGYLPADANGDAVANARDILALIDDLNGIRDPLPIWSVDINRSDQANAQDILRLIDLLNGAGAFPPYLNATLP